MQRNKRLRKYIFVLLMLFAASSAFCSTYYLDPNGSDTTGDGSITLPWQTIPKAVTAVAAGDTIYLRGGTHHYTSTVSITPSGTSSNYITMQAYPGEAPIVDFTGQVYGTTSRGVSLSGSYWHIKGFIIQYAGDNGLSIDGSYNIAEQIVSRRNSDSGIQLGGSGSYNLVVNCDSYLNYDAPNGGENADGFAVKSTTIGPGNIFRWCRSWNNADDGFDLYYATGGITFEGCWSFRNGINFWGASTWNGDGNGFKLGEGSGEHVLIDCLAYDTYHNGIDINGDTSIVHVYNCIAINCRTNDFLFDEAVASVLRNNIAYQGRANINAAVDAQYNSWNGFTVTDSDFLSLDANGIDGPRQADGNLPDIGFMHLAVGSDLIDGGTDVGLPYHGSAPDLGCYEYFVDLNETNPPTPNPMTWATVPTASGSTSITMIATTAYDISAPVQYYFECTTDAGKTSGWQTSTTYVATGLTPSTSYSFRVKARDNATIPNETGWSSTLSATTFAPSPEAGTVTQNMSSSALTSATFSHTVAAGDNRLLLVSVMIKGDKSASSVTYAGNALTKAVSRATTSSGCAVEIWYLIAPPVGTASVVVNFAASTDPSGITAVNFTGVDQSSPIGATASSTATSGTAISTSITTLNTNSVIFGALSNYGGDTDPYTPGSGITELWDNATGTSTSSDVGVWGGNKPAPTAGTYTFNATATASDDWTIAAIEIKAAPLVDTTPPAAPTGLTATAGFVPVVLDWSNNSESDLAGYNVYRSTTSGSGYSKLNSTLLTDSNYIDNINTTDITYYYVVTAVDTTSNESDYSSEEVFSGLYGDFTGNKIVELNDLAEFVTYWLSDNCNETAGVDLGNDCRVNFDEFAAFADNWMK